MSYVPFLGQQINGMEFKYTKYTYKYNTQWWTSDSNMNLYQSDVHSYFEVRISNLYVIVKAKSDRTTSKKNNKLSYCKRI